MTLSKQLGLTDGAFTGLTRNQLQSVRNEAEMVTATLTTL